MEFTIVKITTTFYDDKFLELKQRKINKGYFPFVFYHVRKHIYVAYLFD